jgi:lysozyme
MTDCSCIDISHWQGFPDFETVAQQGVVACIMKATEGTSYIDPNRSDNFIAATDAGIACCTYHWIKPGNPVDQMKFYLDTLDPVHGERVVIDYEENGCTLDELEDAVTYLLDDKRQLQITVYSGHLLKEQLNGDHNSLLADHTDLWLAQYTDGDPSWSDGTYEKWTLWQYSESGVLDGIDDSNVDLNRFNGSDVTLVQWISPSGGKPPPKPPKPPANETADISITASDGVSVSVSVNGTQMNFRRTRKKLFPARRGADLKR